MDKRTKQALVWGSAIIGAGLYLWHKTAPAKAPPDALEAARIAARLVAESKQIVAGERTGYSDVP